MADDSTDDDLDNLFTSRSKVPQTTARSRQQPSPTRRRSTKASVSGRRSIDTSVPGRRSTGGRGQKRQWHEIENEELNEGGDNNDTAQLPAYLQQRRERFKRKREKNDLKALKLPPDFDEVYFSGDERMDKLAERPALQGVTTSAPYEDIEMTSSAGVIPAPIAQWLRPYQVDGVKFMHEAFVYQRGVILGDDMGLGKTIQVIACLTAAFGKTGDERDAKRMRTMRRYHRDRWYPRVLLVAPGFLLSNWQNELDRWGWWSTYHYTGAEKADALAAAESGRLEIMLTTYTTYRLNEAAINNIQWDCVIADECHILKERKSKITVAMNNVNALCRIGLTGTAIQNNYEELWTLLDWINPGQVGSMPQWRSNISIPLRTGQSHGASVAQLARARRTAVALAKDLLPRYLLRRMKSLIAHQLPKKSDKIVFCPLSERQLEAYSNICDTELMQSIRAGDQVGDLRQFLFPALVTLQKLSNHLALLVPSSDSDPEKHDRELQFLQDAVPVGWRTMYAQRDSIRNYANQEFCGKWRVLRKMLKLWYENGDKVLVFSHSVRLLKMLHSLFQSKTSYTVSYLDGSLSYEERQRTVDEYNSSPDRFVFLISTRAGGVGLNITSANKVVVVDPNWNPAWDLQAQDRAYRIGQTRDVDVFRLVSVDTIEEVVYARQIYKQQQANIGYNASAERRYFKGVQDNAAQRGEIFGVANLFAAPGERIALREIVNKTNVAETRAGVEIAGLDMEALQGTSDHPDDNDDDGDDDAYAFDHDASQEKALSDLAASILDEPGQRKRKAARTAKKKDPIQAILDSVGVQYTHENAEVIGTSKIEMQISSRAQKAGDNIDWGRETAFGKSQNSDLDDADPEAGPSSAGLAANGRHYVFNPPEDVRQRQFCSMARWYGFDNVSEFAMVVEGWNQERRRRFLDDFYRHRQRLLCEE